MVKAKQSRPPLVRMLRIHQELADGRFPNCRSLADTIEVSRKTILRDLSYMRDQLNLPIEYDNSGHGYFYRNAVTNFPVIKADEGEMLALFVAGQALAQFKGTPFEGPLATAFGKLAQIMDTPVSVDLAELARILSFRHTGLVQTDLAIFKKVSDALLDSREIEFSYLKLKAKSAERRRVQPYHLGNFDGQWYLFGHDLDRRDIRTFVISRIQEITGLGQHFDKPKDFSLPDHLRNTFGVYFGDGDYEVRIQFTGYAARLVRERQWHPSQKLREFSDHRVELHMQLGSLEEVERWVLSWGPEARVMSPPQLRSRVKQALSDMQDNYAPSSAHWFLELQEAAMAYGPERLFNMVLAMGKPAKENPQQMLLWRGSVPVNVPPPAV